jgi:hypothetical protein
MNILMILLLPLVVHGDEPCPQLSTASMNVQMVAANRQGADGHVSVRNGHDLIETGASLPRGSEQSDYAGTAEHPGPGDLLFYFSSHAQAVGDTSGPTMKPWLELRPIADVEQAGLSGASEPVAVGEDHACSRSAAHAPAFASARLAGDV